MMAEQEKRYPLYYIHSNNFGDAINPYLYYMITTRFPDEVIVPGEPKILACGSVAHMAQPGDIVWGTGCNPDLPLQTDVTTRIMALRGPLSAEMFYEHGHEDITEIYGDPALLLSRHYNFSVPYKQSQKRFEIGVIPHYVDENSSHRREFVSTDISLHKIRLINIMNPDQLGFIKEVLECEWIISSALHGIVCAESYGIPAVWVEFSDNVAGHGFKFRDYYLGTNRLPPEPLDWRTQINLEEAIEMKKDWQPPEVDLDSLEQVCPFNWVQTDYKRWQKVDSYTERNRRVAKLLEPGMRILEFGAGNQELRMMLPPNCQYTPSDIVMRRLEYIVCDLNTDKLLPLNAYDTVVLSGVLEYLVSIPKFFEYMTRSKSVKTIICSYQTSVDIYQRIHNGWNNSYKQEDLIHIMIKAGFWVETQAQVAPNEVIYRLRRI